MADAASSLANAQAVKLALQVVQTLGLTQWEFPADCSARISSKFNRASLLTFLSVMLETEYQT